MKIIKTKFEGLYIFQGEIFKDKRGFLREIFKKKLIKIQEKKKNDEIDEDASAWKICASLVTTGVIASLPSLTFTIEISSVILPAVAEIVIEVLSPKFAEVRVLVLPLPPRVTLGFEANVALPCIFCKFAVNVIEDGVIVPSLATWKI